MNVASLSRSLSSAAIALLVLSAGCASSASQQRDAHSAHGHHETARMSQCQSCFESVLVSTDRMWLVASVQLKPSVDPATAIECMKVAINDQAESAVDTLGLRPKDAAALCLAAVAKRRFGLPVLSEPRARVFEERDESIRVLLESVDD